MDTKKKEDPRVESGSFQVQEYAQRIFFYKAQQGHTRDHLLNPAYWSHVAEQVQPWNEIWVRSEDGTYYGKFLVLEAGRTYLKIRMLEWHNLTTADVALSQSYAGTKDDYFVEFKGPNKKHVVLRKSDNAIMQEGISSKMEADLWVEAFVKVPA